MKEKTNEQLVEEFFANGGKIEKIETIPYETSTKVTSTTKKVPQLKTLAEGEFLYGKKKKVKKKIKKPDYSGINMDLIPDHIKSLIKLDDKPNTNQNKEETNETNKNSRSSKTNNKS